LAVQQRERFGTKIHRREDFEDVFALFRHLNIDGKRSHFPQRRALQTAQFIFQLIFERDRLETADMLTWFTAAIGWGSHSASVITGGASRSPLIVQSGRIRCTIPVRPMAPNAPNSNDKMGNGRPTFHHPGSLRHLYVDFRYGLAASFVATVSFALLLVGDRHLRLPPQLCAAS